MNVLDLFSGIGGFSLGLERAGMRTVAFCEIDPYCQAVLRKHWPDVLVFNDVRTLTNRIISNATFKQMGASRQPRVNESVVDVVCGGFPCQDISVAGKGEGIDGSRSGLWKEFARIIGEVRPRYVIVENVAALLGRGIGRVLGDLAALGFDCEWHCIPASAVGAPHRRDRVWIVAYPAGRREQSSSTQRNERRFQIEIMRGMGNSGYWHVEPDVGRVAHGLSPSMDGDLNAPFMGTKESGPAGSIFGERLLRELWRFRPLAAASFGLQQTNGSDDPLPSVPCESGSGGGFPTSKANEEMQALRQGVSADAQQEAQSLQSRMPLNRWPHECDETMGIWEIEPDVPRVASGVKHRVDRLRSLGNAIVPQIAEIIGRAIMEHEQTRILRKGEG